MNTILITLPEGIAPIKQAFFEAIKTVLTQEYHYQVMIAYAHERIQENLEMNQQITAVLFDFSAGKLDFCADVVALNNEMPIFAFVAKDSELHVDLNTINLNLYFFSYKTDQVHNICERIDTTIQEYLGDLIPPFTQALMHYAAMNRYHYCTPGHSSGLAFLRSPGGRLFHDFFGENIFKSDLSVSMGELGSLLDHSGKPKEAEEYIAKLYGADHSYIVTNGTSTSNKMIGMHVLSDGDSLVVDRNCHKSLTHLMMMTNVVPLYLKPSRNHYGIIGGIALKQFTKASIQQQCDELSQRLGGMVRTPNYCVITNSTYDGIMYNTARLKKLLPVKHIHFDAAWIAYAPFSPIYAGHYGIDGEVGDDKVVYESFSTHKLLAAFSQSATIQIRGKSFDNDAFNDTYMMHTSTSPFYPMIASTEMAAAMMRGQHGQRLMSSTLREVMTFRHEVERLRDENDKIQGGWFYDIFQPKSIPDEAECFAIKPCDQWHGFTDVDADHLSLDPIKVTLLTPGLQSHGGYDDFGIPACLLAKFLDYQGIIVEKTGPYSLLFLFGIGSDRSHSLKLLNELASFKKSFDDNDKVEKVLPNLFQEAPRFYKRYRIQELAQSIHDIYRRNSLCEKMYQAYGILPEMVMTPYQARQQIIKENVVKTPLKALQGKVAAEMILPYPPGIPVLVPGEVVTDDTVEIIDFLATLCEIGEIYPGLETSIHGLKYEDGVGYYTYTIKT